MPSRTKAIDYRRLPESLAERSVKPGDPKYADVRSTYVHRGSPGVVFRPQSAGEVADGLSYALSRGVPLAIRSGGHGIRAAATNDGGVVLDLKAMNRIEIIDQVTRRVRIGPGATWGEVAAVLARRGWAISSGDFGDIGVGGLAISGGVGLLSRLHGLTIDHVVGAELVLSDGSQVSVGVEEHPDLFWALRGAGAFLAIATSLEFEAKPLKDVTYVVGVLDATDTAGMLQRWGEAQESAPRELTSFVIITDGSDRPPLAETTTVYAGSAAKAVGALARLADVAPLLDAQVHVVSYADVMRPQQTSHLGRGPVGIRAGIFSQITQPVAAGVSELLESGAAWGVQIKPVGGAVQDVGPSATAFAHRNQNFSINAVTSDPQRNSLDPAWDELVYPHASGLYLNFDNDQRPERILDAYPTPTLAKLLEVCREYDPQGVFSWTLREAASALPITVGDLGPTES